MTTVADTQWFDTLNKGFTDKQKSQRCADAFAPLAQAAEAMANPEAARAKDLAWLNEGDNAQTALDAIVDASDLLGYMQGIGFDGTDRSAALAVVGKRVRELAKGIAAHRDGDHQPQPTIDELYQHLKAFAGSLFCSIERVERASPYGTTTGYVTAIHLNNAFTDQAKVVFGRDDDGQRAVDTCIAEARQKLIVYRHIAQQILTAGETLLAIG